MTITICTTTSRNTIEATTENTFAQLTSDLDMTGMTVVFNGTPISVADMTREIGILYDEDIIHIKTMHIEGNNMLVVVPAMKAGC